MSERILEQYEAAHAVFMSGAIEAESDKQLLSHLSGLSNQNNINVGTQHRDVIRGLTVNNILLKRHLDRLQDHITELNRSNGRTQWAVIALTVASLFGTGLQSLYAYRADLRADQESAAKVAGIANQVAPAVGGTTRVSVDGSQDEVSSYSSYNAQDSRNAAEQAAAQGGSIAQTFDRANGGTVMVEGMRTSAANAQRMGLIRMEGGRPFDVSSGKASGPSISPQTKAAEPSIDDLKIAPESTALPPAEHFDSAEWDAYEGDIEPIAQPAFNGAISRGTLAAMNGTSLQDVVSHLSKDENMSLERASMLASSVEGMFKGVVNRAVAAEGITPADLPGFYAYCRDQRNCQEAIAELVSQRKTGLFKRFASEYSARMARHAGVNG